MNEEARKQLEKAKRQIEEKPQKKEGKTEMRLDELKERVKTNFLNLFRQGKINEFNAKRMIDKVDVTPKAELECWLADTEKELKGWIKNKQRR